MAENPLRKLVEFYLVTNVRCGACGKELERADMSNDISVEIPEVPEDETPPPTLQDLLAKTFLPETPQGRDTKSSIWRQNSCRWRQLIQKWVTDSGIGDRSSANDNQTTSVHRSPKMGDSKTAFLLIQKAT